MHIHINTYMDRETLYKWYKRILAALPVFAVIATSLMWVDTRYMHKEVSDIRFIDIQIRIIEGQIKDYNRILEAGGELSVDDRWKYEMDLEQLKNLMNERNKVLDIGEIQ